MKVIKEYKPCEVCKGTGLEWEGQYSWDCRVCQGYGEVIETRREIEDVSMETERRRTEQN